MSETSATAMTSAHFEIATDHFGGNQLAAGGAFIERIRTLLATWAVALPPRDVFLKLVGDGYDKYIAPIDIPGLPNFVVEPWVDSALRAIVLSQAGKLYDAFSAQS